MDLHRNPFLSEGELQHLPSSGTDGSNAGGEQAIASLIEQCLATAPLRTACERGDLTSVQQALRRAGPLPSYLSSTGTRSALQAAVSNGQAAVVRYLLQEGVPADLPEVSAGNSSGEQKASPYTIQAALSGSAETIRVLADNGLSLTERGHAATLERGGGKRCVARASLVTNPLGAAAWALQLEALTAVAELMPAGSVENGFNAAAELRPLVVGSERAPRRDARGGGAASARLQEFAWAQGATALVLAVHSAGRAAESGGDASAQAAAEVLLSRRADPSVANSLGDTALHVAARFGLSQTLRVLLEAGADPMQRNAQGDTAGAVAARAGRTQCAEELRSAEASGKDAAGIQTLTSLEEEEEAERARLDRAREQRREKRSRQKERQKAQRGTTLGAAAAIGEPTVSSIVRPGEQMPGSDEEDEATATVVATKPVAHLGVDALRAKIAEAQRERTHVARQLRQAQRKSSEDSARADRSQVQVVELQQQVAELQTLAGHLGERAQAADHSEQCWRKKAQEAGEAAQATWQAAQAAQSAEEREHEASIAKLQAELDAMDRDERKRSDPSSSEAERARRIAAEERCQELERAIKAASAELQPNLSNVQVEEALPLFEHGSMDSMALGRARPEHAEVLRQLHKQQSQHCSEMRDLVSLLGQQLQERDRELDQDFQAILGRGLPRLLGALHREGLLNTRASTRAEPAQVARLQAALLT